MFLGVHFLKILMILKGLISKNFVHVEHLGNNSPLAKKYIMFGKIQHEGGREKCGEPVILLSFSMLPLANSCKNE